MPEFTARNATVIDFSNPRNIQLPEIYHPQSCILKLDNKSIDIGSHCFAVRKLNSKGFASTITKNSQGIGVVEVDLNSLDKRRLPFIKKIIEFGAYRAISNSQIYLYNQLRNLLPFFQFYFSQSDLEYSSPENRAHYEEAARRYSAALNHATKTGAGHKHQCTNVVFRLAEFIFPNYKLYEFDYGIISTFKQVTRGTIPLLPEEQELALALRTSIFDAAVDLSVNYKPLPYPLKIPTVCGELKNTIWIGYSPWPGMANFPRAKDFERRQCKEWFDRNLGTLLTKEQWLEHVHHRSKKAAYDAWYSIQKLLQDNNRSYSNFRQTMAEYGATSFIDLFLSVTGMNQQPALDLPWYGGYSIQKGKQGDKIITLLKVEHELEFDRKTKSSAYLRSIKNRKGYQPIEVTISNRFLSKFRSYLQLREYYLNGSTDARLFPFVASLIAQKRHAIHKAFPEIPKLGAHKARASISDNILTATNDPRVASQILQNDPKTLIKYYAAGTQKSRILSMGGFFNALGNQVTTTRNGTKNKVETAVGSCNNGGTHPDAIPDAPIESNCTQQVGCFFCKHFCVHADEVDVRKLFSVLYYINKGATRAHDIDYFNKLFDLVINRIKELLKQIEVISDKKKALVARIQKEVFTEEALDYYWLCKLNRLEIFIGEH
jgi:hypothetical protein